MSARLLSTAGVVLAEMRQSVRSSISPSTSPLLTSPGRNSAAVVAARNRMSINPTAAAAVGEIICRGRPERRFTSLVKPCRVDAARQKFSLALLLSLDDPETVRVMRCALRGLYPNTNCFVMF